MFVLGDAIVRPRAKQSYIYDWKDQFTLKQCSIFSRTLIIHGGLKAKRVMGVMECNDIRSVREEKVKGELNGISSAEYIASFHCGKGRNDIICSKY